MADAITGNKQRKQKDFIKPPTESEAPQKEKKGECRLLWAQAHSERLDPSPGDS
jgi:hypothetical protein